MIDGPALLLILRVLSALVLLAFLGIIAWFLQRELTVTAKSLSNDEVTNGFLRVMLPDAIVERHPLRQIVSIGRTLSNTIVLDNNYTSAQHALITRRDNQWWLEDLKSRNGTLINNIPVEEPTAISTGDQISIGDVTLMLEL